MMGDVLRKTDKQTNINALLISNSKNIKKRKTNIQIRKIWLLKKMQGRRNDSYELCLSWT